MMSNRWSKIIKSLQIKKLRKELELFLVEGEKCLIELLNSELKIEQLFLSEKFISKHQDIIINTPFNIIHENLIKKHSSLATNDSGIAIVNFIEQTDSCGDKILLLDNIQDPGNLGTIIRVADWYAFDTVICSNDTVDYYNTKVIQATMGSLFRVPIIQTSLENFISDNKHRFYAATLNGKSVHSTTFHQGPTGFILGNESKGVSNKIISLCENEIMIPRFGKAESLNVAMATSIICDNYKRQFTGL